MYKLTVQSYEGDLFPTEKSEIFGNNLISIIRILIKIRSLYRELSSQCKL